MSDDERPDRDTRGAAADAFEDLPAPVWEVRGPTDVVVAANRAARELFGVAEPAGRPLRDVLPGLERSAFSQLAAVRGRERPVRRTGWAVETPGRRMVLEVDLVPVHRRTGRSGDEPGVLVHTCAVVGAPAAARDAVLELQRVLLPGSLPVLPQLDLAAHYLPGTLGPAAGGDWFDAQVLADGRVVGHTGDVVGGGTAAAAAAAALRIALGAALAEDPDLPRALARLDRLATRSPATRGAAVAVVLLDPATGEFRHARCGHPPPVVHGLDGTARALDGDAAAPLGVGGDPPRVSGGRLAPGETLFLHTDGLPHTGRARYRAPITGSAADLGRAVLDALVSGGPDDDVALLLLRRRADPVPALELDVPARIDELAGSRARITEWLDALDLAVETLTAVPLVVTELISNSIEHAYPGGRNGRVRTTVELDGRGGLRCTVTDDGRWLDDPAPSESGFGLVVVHELCDSVQIRTGPAGTRVTAVCPAVRTVSLDGAAAAPRLRAVDHQPLRIVDVPGDPRRIEVAGPVDAATVDELRAAILRRSVGGTRPLLVDLGGVTLLGSAGIRMLHGMAAMGVPPVVVVDGDGPARRALDAAGLTHRTRR